MDQVITCSTHLGTYPNPTVIIFGNVSNGGLLQKSRVFNQIDLIACFVVEVASFGSANPDTTETILKNSTNKAAFGR